MAVLHKNQSEYWELLIAIAEAAQEVVEESECWVTNDHFGCGKCRWCRLASLTDKAREEPDS